MTEEFKKLGFSKEVLTVIEKEGFEKPTEIQIKTIPLALRGKDIIGGSATGSGKTLAFGSAILENLEKKGEVQSIVLTPTRELAEQVSTSLKKFGKHKSLRITSVYGGVAIEPQMKALRIADVVVATPGRILDHLQRGTIDLSKVKILVLDEVDRMFDMGFREDVERIISQCSKHRQTMLFSATVTSDIDYFSKKYTKDPEVVMVESYVDPSKLRQAYYDVEPGLKFALLVHLLKHESSDLVMVFCNTRENSDFVGHNLKLNGINAEVIHGGLSQKRRTDTLEGFHEGNVHVLVATDVAARGLDIKGVTHVYNYDIPKNVDDYIHRIGRTARAGEKGKAIHILSPRDYDNFRKIMREFGGKIDREEVPYIQRVQMDTRQRRDTRGSGRDSRGGRDDRRTTGRRGDEIRGGRGKPGKTGRAGLSNRINKKSSGYGKSRSHDAPRKRSGSAGIARAGHHHDY